MHQNISFTRLHLQTYLPKLFIFLISSNIGWSSNLVSSRTRLKAVSIHRHRLRGWFIHHWHLGRDFHSCNIRFLFDFRHLMVLNRYLIHLCISFTLFRHSWKITPSRWILHSLNPTGHSLLIHHLRMSKTVLVNARRRFWSLYDNVLQSIGIILWN